MWASAGTQGVQMTKHSYHYHTNGMTSVLTLNVGTQT